MTPHPIELPWGAEKISLNLPEAWQITGILEPSTLPGVPDPTRETARSLQSPAGSQRLSALVKPGARIALVIDDSSRPTPVSAILPAVFDELEHGNVQRDQVTVVPALGLHRPMTQEEIELRTGMKNLNFKNPECDNPDRLVYLGTTSRGTPVHICKTVAEADLVLSIGCIEPHIIASFGGGYKNLFPGAAGRVTIAHNHSLNCTSATFNSVGQPVENNPMRLDLEEAGRLIKPPVFVVNAVLNSSLQVVRVVCGDAVAAHREGIRTSAEIYGVQVPGLADVVITDSCPMDQDLRQGVKALANTVRAVKPGGVMIVLVKAGEGVGVFGLANRKLPLGRKALKLLAPVLIRLVPKLKLKGMGEEDRFFLYFALQAMHRATLLMYAPTIPAETRANLPFVEFVDNPEEALSRARQRFPGKAGVLVFPHGGSTYPILPG